MPEYVQALLLGGVYMIVAMHNSLWGYLYPGHARRLTLPLRLAYLLFGLLFLGGGLIGFLAHAFSH